MHDLIYIIERSFWLHKETELQEASRSYCNNPVAINDVHNEEGVEVMTSDRTWIRICRLRAEDMLMD